MIRAGIQARWYPTWQRGAQLAAYTSRELHSQLTALGWKITGRQTKLARINAFLHLEGHPLPQEIIDSLGLVQTTPVPDEEQQP